MSGEIRYMLIIVGVFVVLILGLLVWAAFFRKSRQKRKRIDRRHHWEMASSERGKHRHRHHRKPSGEIPRNPTLAESGGLPPPRPHPLEPPEPPIA